MSGKPREELGGLRQRTAVSQREDEEQRDWSRGRQTIRFREGEEEKETDLGLRLGEEGYRGRKNEESEREKN